VREGLEPPISLDDPRTRNFQGGFAASLPHVEGIGFGCGPRPGLHYRGTNENSPPILVRSRAVRCITSTHVLTGAGCIIVPEL
jgi:hypothetical protein